MEQSAVLHRAKEHREIPAVQESKGLHYVPDGFLAHLMYGHCEDAALRMIVKAPDLYGKGLTPMGACAAGLRRQEVHMPWYAVLCGTQLWLVTT